MMDLCYILDNTDASPLPPRGGKRAGQLKRISLKLGGPWFLARKTTGGIAP